MSFSHRGNFFKTDKYVINFCLCFTLKLKLIKKGIYLFNKLNIFSKQALYYLINA